MPQPEKLEEKLHLSELRYRRLFETAQDGILILDAASGKITDANPFLKDLLGYNEKELFGKQLWEIGVLQNIVDSKKLFLELQTSGYVRYKDLALQTNDGRSIYIEFISNMYRVDKEKVIQCNIRDCTSRKEAEKAVETRTKELEKLSTSQEQTKKAMLNVMEDLAEAKGVIEIEKVKDEAVLASIGEGLIAVDTNRKVIIMNTAAEEMLGWKIEEMLGREITNFPLEDEEGNPVPFDKRPIQLALKSEKLVNSAYFFVRKDKTRFPVAINVTPIKLAGKMIGAIDIFRDITHEKEIDKAKNEFVSIASHQLRTPLGIMKWYLEALENQEYFSKAPAVIKAYFDEIYKNNERVLSLVRDLLSVSRINQGQVKNIPKSVDLIQVVKGVVKQLQIAARKKSIALQVTMQDQKIPSISIDGLRFHEVIENLIANALEYTMPGGSVDVTLRNVDNTFLVSVQDTGIGISARDQKKLYTKFFRSEKAVKHNPEGSGLGLYLVKSYVEGWGGTISVESSEEKGSVFTISLPISLKKEAMKGGDLI